MSGIALIEPTCQASLIRYSDPLDGEPSRLLFSNPAHQTKRVRMTVRISYDEGKSWARTRLLHAGPSAYSCLTRLPSGDVGMLYEAGDNSPYEAIRFARFPITWLEAPARRADVDKDGGTAAPGRGHPQASRRQSGNTD